LTRSPVEDPDMIKVCRDAGIGIVSSYSLQGGLLSGKYQGAGADAGRLTKDLATPAVQAMLPKVDAVVSIAREIGCTPSQLAMAYCLKNADVSSLLFGARRVAQVEENIGALRLLPALTDDVLARLRGL
jgi:aryl-alcohol dehydrogenase-like predicted oxidoreductase